MKPLGRDGIRNPELRGDAGHQERGFMPGERHGRLAVGVDEVDLNAVVILADTIPPRTNLRLAVESRRSVSRNEARLGETRRAEVGDNEILHR